MKHISVRADPHPPEMIFFSRYPPSQLQKVFLPSGTDFLRRNFPNIEEEFS